ncbi:helix-turn-helix transcriptional regulator [Candidatus Dojkabacteria bacterium]|nr:helix-turn-helix transcriptional regulator [Candidatus Dojkabacteria bacterium]
MNSKLKTKLRKYAIPYEKAFVQDMKKAQFRRLVRAKKRYFETLSSIKKLRKQKGFSQEKLAKLAGLPRRTIVRIESGQKNTTIDTLISIASAMEEELVIRLK